MTGWALLERPERGTLLRSYAGSVPADPDRVFAALVPRLSPPTPEGGSFAHDPVTRELVVQGGWWYRGEWRVLPDPDGSRIEYEIVNVAQPAHWLGPITGRRELKAAPSAFARLLGELHDELA
jgi:hypothetical protein